MANETFTANQTTVATPGFDADNDGVIDPGEQVTTTVTITNNSTTPTPVNATGVQFTEDLQGMTLVNQAGDDINASPIAFDDSYTAAGNVAFTGVAMLNNDAEPLGPEGLALNGGTAIQNTGVAFATTQGGSVTLNANGTFTYISAVGFEGVDTFTYTLRDTGLDAVAGNADDLSGTGTVSITVGPSVWFIDNTAAPGGNGTQASPFNSIAAFNLAQGTANGPDAGDFIYLRFGTGTYSEADGINLATGQTLIGQGQNLVVNGVTIEVGSAGLTPTIQVTGADEGVLLAQNNTLSGFNISTTNAAADGIEDGGGTVGTLNISNVSIAGTGQAVDIDQGGTLNVTLASVTSTGSSEEGIQLAGVAGSFTASTVSLNGMTGDGIDLDNNSATVAINGGTIGNSNDPGGIGVDINAGSASVTIVASVTKTTAGDIVEVTGRTAGTVDFNGNITSNTNGIDITGNTGGTVRFDGGMNLSTGATTAFNSTGNTGMTLVVTDPGAGSNILTTTTGTALNVANTSIGTEGLTFQSISSSGASSGIVLNNTGTAAGNGGLTVTGTGTTDGSGGTIANSTSHGISLTSTKAVNLSNVNVSGSGDDGINGSSVNGFTLTNVNITNNGNAVGDRGIDMTQLSGSGGIADSTISGSAETNIRIENDTANLTAFNITGSTISNTNMTTGDDGILVLDTGSASMTVSVTGSTFTDNKGDHFQAATDADATGPMNITFNNNTLNTTVANDPNVIGGGITINTSGSTDITFQINNNNIQQAFDDGININLDPGSLAGASMTGTISGNTIGTSGVQSSGSESSNTITVAAKGQGLVDIDILNNNIFEWTNAFGILLQNSEGSADLIAKVTGNTLHTTFPQPFPINGIQLNAGATASDNGFVELVLTGNDVTGEGNPAAGDADIRLRQRFLTTVELPGYTGANTDTAAVNAFVAANNDPAGATPAPTVSSVQNVAGGGGGFIGGTATPLLAASGGVESADNTPRVVGTPSTDHVPLQDKAGAPSAAPVTPVPTVDATPPVGGGDPQSPVTGSESAAPPAVGITPVPPVDPTRPVGGDDPQPPVPGGEPPSQEPAGGGATAHAVIVDDGVLSQPELDFLVDAAIARWTATGLSTAQIAALEAMSFGVADLSGLNLGSFSPAQITLDADAAGHGWYLDGTPRDDAEFGNTHSATRLTTDPTQAPAGHYDLLTTVMHEMGHTLGLEDRYEGTARDGLMYGWLFTGERRLPGDGEADGAVAGSIAAEEFLGAPVDIGVLPAGKTVTIQWQATVNPQTNQLIVNPVNTGTVSATNAVGFLDTNTNTVTTTLDMLSLGGTIWHDNGAGGGISGNGLRDGTEPGIDGVALTLFADTGTTAGVWDAGDAQVATTATAGGGNYAFTGLAPGEYIVRVDQDNFDAGGNTSLVATPISSVTSPEPPDPDDGDPDVDNDDNGSRVPGQAAFSNAITLAYNTEPTAGTGNDTNTTLDFGFLSNPPPDLSGLQGDTATFTEGDPAVLLDDASAPEVAATVTDDQTHFSGGSLTVSITANEVAAEDVLGISAAGTVTLSNGTNNGSIVSVGGLAIGTVTSNGTGGNDLVVTFNTTDATPANVGTLINALTYFNSNTLNPSTLQRTIAVTVNDGLAGTDTETAFVNVTDINDEPTLIATGQNPTFTEGGAAADIYSAVAASTVESGQTFTSMTLTVTNVTDGTDEILNFDGSDVALTNGNSVAGTATNGLTVNVNVTGSTATVSFSGAALSAAQLQTLVDGMTYRDTSQNPTDADRVVTITQLVDSGSNVNPNDNTATLNIASTVNVDPTATLFTFGQPTFELAAFAPGAEGWISDDLYKRELADVNGDGMDDIVGFGAAGVYVSLATGDGHFAAHTFELAAFAPGAEGWISDDLYKRELADVNGDHMADIVGFGAAGVYVSLATGNGHFAPHTFELAAFAPGAEGWISDDLYKRELADVNGDHMADIVGFGAAGVYVSLATGNGHFAPHTFELAAFAPGAEGWISDDLYKRELADVNGDHMADIVGFGAAGVYVSLATGDGHFAAHTFELAAFAPGAEGWISDDLYKRELADVNGDGMDDIVGFGAAGVYVSLATGDGHFAAHTFELAAFAPGAEGWISDDLYKRELADVNGDHMADIVGFGAAGVYVSQSHDFLLI